jgi:hypothetical protein
LACRPEHVTGYVDAALPPWLEREVERHLSICPMCGAQAAFELELRETLGSLGGGIGDRLAQRVLAAVRTDARRRAH